MQVPKPYPLFIFDSQYAGVLVEKDVETFVKL